MALGVAQVRGNRRLEHRRLDRLQQARLRRAPEIAGIDRDEDVRRARRAFRGQALDERRAVIRDGLHFDAALATVLLEQLVHELVLARGIDDEGLAGGLGRAGERDAGQCRKRRPGAAAGQYGSS